MDKCDACHVVHCSKVCWWKLWAICCAFR